jgi:hypothetical protein
VVVVVAVVVVVDRVVLVPAVVDVDNMELWIDPLDHASITATFDQS